jgi:hypothetical protein
MTTQRSAPSPMHLTKDANWSCASIQDLHEATRAVTNCGSARGRGEAFEPLIRPDLRLRDALGPARVLAYVPRAGPHNAMPLCAHQPAARASAIPTPTAESPPMTEASHTTSRASSRTDFHIGGLPPLRGRSTAKAAVGSSHRHAHHRNFAAYGTAHNPSSLSSNPRAQTTDVLAVKPNLARITDGATPAPGLDRCDCPANAPEQSWVAEPSSATRGYAAGGGK